MGTLPEQTPAADLIQAKGTPYHREARFPESPTGAPLNPLIGIAVRRGQVDSPEFQLAIARIISQSQL